jgi:hypothetical protein
MYLVCDLFYDAVCVLHNTASNVVVIIKQWRERIWKYVTIEVLSEHLLGVTKETHELFPLG